MSTREQKGRAVAPSRAHRSRENTRERLLEAAVDVFVEKGLKRVTVDDLVQAAGFTRGAFYSNFDSVDEVFFEVFRRRATAMIDHARAAIAAVPDEEFDVAFVGRLIDEMTVPGDPWVVLHAEFTLFAVRNTDARVVLDAYSETMRAELADLIGEVLRRLGRRPAVPLPQLAQVVSALQIHSALLAQTGDPVLTDGTLGAKGMSEELVRRLVLGFSEPE
ncbi:TetR/AcrR family transcriptional regulator [Nocardioides daphniae]|uniref:TetR-family regulatory protein n=1 Tax=Nocardioides daphniae TaxID=402297 RepID=A0ABQ1PY85_9ACTN|nr:TetR/AcrR family transcriptional regulator [Nocardioides daphniae]GGD06806.1 putative TetR-family regulatory protein [Nocardioides daphniae]